MEVFQWWNTLKTQDLIYKVYPGIRQFISAWKCEGPFLRLEQCSRHRFSRKLKGRIPSTLMGPSFFPLSLSVKPLSATFDGVLDGQKLPTHTFFFLGWHSVIVVFLAALWYFIEKNRFTTELKTSFMCLFNPRHHCWIHLKTSCFSEPAIMRCQSFFSSQIIPILSFYWS